MPPFNLPARHIFFLGWVGALIGEFVGFAVIFINFPTQQSLVNNTLMPWFRFQRTVWSGKSPQNYHCVLFPFVFAGGWVGKKQNLTPWRPSLRPGLSSARAGPRPLATSIFPGCFGAPRTTLFMKIYGCLLACIWISFFLYISYLSWNLHFSLILPRTKHALFFVWKPSEIWSLWSFHWCVFLFLLVNPQTLACPSDILGCCWNYGQFLVRLSYLARKRYTGETTRQYREFCAASQFDHFRSTPRVFSRVYYLWYILMRSHETRSTRDRSISRSLQRWVSAKSSISQLTSCHFIIYALGYPGTEPGYDAWSGRHQDTSRWYI